MGDMDQPEQGTHTKPFIGKWNKKKLISVRLSCSILQKYPVFISSYGTSIRCCTSKFTYDVQRRLYQLHLYDALGFCTPARPALCGSDVPYLEWARGYS